MQMQASASHACQGPRPCVKCAVLRWIKSSKVEEFEIQRHDPPKTSDMSLRRSLTRSLQCGSCRNQLLDSFLAAAGLSLPVSRASPSSPLSHASWQRKTRLAQRSTYSTATTKDTPTDSLQDATSSPHNAKTEELDDLLDSIALNEEASSVPPTPPSSANGSATSADESVIPAHESTTSANEAAVPWYLQVEPPIVEQSHALSERQRLPDLPDYSPDILQPILEHVSKDLGIDDLSLLDLRALDPPPALGANLLMIIGTARSEKHLHVSADRLCRWLRSNHGLTPFADGLLGRNELKLKMRRKAKRSRLLSAVGAKETGSGSVDDGIRTGWVCVSVGRVKGGVTPEQQEKDAQDIENFVGFGAQSSRCNIVVQLMTDEKRGEIDLETLWEGILRRSKKSQQDQKGEVADTESRPAVEKPIVSIYDEAGEDETELYRPTAPRPGRRRFPASAMRSSSSMRSRAFHTSAILRQLPDDPFFDKKGAHDPGNIPTTDNISDPTPTNRCHEATLTMNTMLDKLEAMESDAAIGALGMGHGDTATTSFLRAFYQAMPAFPDAVHWELHIRLGCHAIRLGHPHYNAKRVFNELDAMRLACVQPTEAIYQMVLETLLSPLMVKEAAFRDPVLYKRTVTLALNVLDMMHEDGLDATSEPILRLLYRTTSLPPLPSYSDMRLSEKLDNADPAQLEPAPITLNKVLPLLSAYAIMRAAASSSWHAVCSLWRSHPRHFRPRSGEAYAALFRSAAQTNDQRIAIDTLRSGVPDMPREEPAVKLEGEVVHAIQECLNVAEPKAREMGERGGRGEWAILWRRITRALGRDV